MIGRLSFFAVALLARGWALVALVASGIGV